MRKPQITTDEKLAGDRFEQAVASSNLRAIQALLEGGFSSIPTECQAAAMRLAIMNGSARTLHLLLRAGVDHNDPSATKESPVYWAAQANQPDLLRDLIAAGADPNGPPGKCAPAESAAMSGNLTILEILIASGIDPKRLDDKGHSLLHYAATFDQEPIARRLLELRVHIDAREVDGLTPLHYAARYGSMQTLQLLVEKGADLDARCNAGMTPALTAAFHGRIDMFAELVASGADPLARDNEGRSAFHLAWGRSQSRDKAPVWVLEHFPSLIPPGEELDKVLVEAVRRGHTELVKKLAELGADLGQKPGGRTLLQCAPAKAEELRRLLRSLKSGDLIASAMGDRNGASTPTSSTPSPL